MTRNFIVLYDIQGKQHVLNATSIIDITDIKEKGFYTISLLDSKSFNVSATEYQKLIALLKPVITGEAPETAPVKSPELSYLM